MTTRMVAGSRSYLLDEETDVEQLEAEVCDAMRRGSGIVSFDLSNGECVSGIFSPGVMVSFERIFASGQPMPLTEHDQHVTHWDDDDL